MYRIPVDGLNIPELKELVPQMNHMSFSQCFFLMRDAVPSVFLKIAMDNDPLVISADSPFLRMVIFHSYVQLPEG